MMNIFNLWKLKALLTTFFFLRPYGSTTGGKSPAQGFLTQKNQSFQHRGKSPVQGFFVKTQSLQYRDRVSHTGELWKTQSPHTPQHRAHTQGTLKKLKVPTHHNTGPTHRGTLKKLKVFTHHSTGPTHREIIFPIGKFSEKINLFQYGSFWKIPSTGIFREKLISLAQGHQGAHRKKKRC